MAKVIITGGTGLIGKRLSALLCINGYEVNILSRHPKHTNEYKWDIDTNFIDDRVFENATAIIHLAGAGIADQRWSEDRKKEIIASRVKPIQLIYQYLSAHPHSIATFISSSAVGYYGDRKDEVLTEESANGTGFLAEVCKTWEDEADRLSALNITVSKVRTGIVLSKDGGALPKLDFPIRFGIGAYIGDGTQYVPWIHIDDLCNMYLHLLDKKITGAFNGCAPGIKTNRQMSETIAKVLHRPFIPLPAPAFIIKTVLGEMAAMLLMSDNCSSQKITATGFKFRFPILEDALQEIYSR